MRPSAIGIVEVSFFTNAVAVLDEMLKSADVSLCSCHKTLGGRLVHLVVCGETASVTAAIAAARRADDLLGGQRVKVAVVISNPHPEIVKLFTAI